MVRNNLKNRPDVVKLLKLSVAFSMGLAWVLLFCFLLFLLLASTVNHVNFNSVNAVDAVYNSNDDFTRYDNEGCDVLHYTIRRTDKSEQPRAGKKVGNQELLRLKPSIISVTTNTCRLLFLDATHVSCYKLGLMIITIRTRMITTRATTVIIQ